MRLCHKCGFLIWESKEPKHECYKEKENLKMNLKAKFITECFSEIGNPTKGFDVLVTLVKLPTGAIEVITNTKQIESKLKYINNAYDTDFKLKSNPDVQIVGYTVY